MPTIKFFDIYFLLPTIWSGVIVWHLFFKNLVKVNNFNTALRKKQVKKILNFKNSAYMFTRIGIIVFFFLINSIIFLKGNAGLYFWLNFHLTNFSIFLLKISYILTLFFFFILSKISVPKYKISCEFFFSIINLGIFLPLIFLSANLLTFIFLLELSTTLVFYKLSVSKNWYSSDNKGQFGLSKQLDLFFFQYWSNFFSTIFIIFFLVVAMYSVGSTNFIEFDFFLKVNNGLTLKKKNYLLYIAYVGFILSFFFKIGLSPFHFYKLEVYKTIPVITLYFYTLVYFFIFLLYFSILLINYFFVLTSMFIWLFFIIFLISLVYLLSLMFNYNFFKLFFLVSSLINILVALLLVFF